jgi:CBS domain-containing protein
MVVGDLHGKGQHMKGHARQFMTTKVVVTTRQTSLAEAARELARLEVSGLPVVDADGQVLGIVTESDVLNALLEETPVESPVQVIMKTPVVTVDEFTPADTVIRLLRMYRVHHLPVTRQGVVVGLITPQEVIRYFVMNELPLPPEVA